MILEEIQKRLQTVDEHVFYGIVDENEVRKDWNYTVFLRKSMSLDTNKGSYSDRFTVAVIRENFIPDGLVESVIKAVCAIPGMRPAGTDCDYNYVKKPGTNMVVEILAIEFVRARKKGS